MNNYLALQDRNIDKYQYTQRMDFVQSSASTWMGRYSYAKENEVSPALKLNGTKLDTRVHQVAVGNTWTLSSTLVNEFRFGYNYFFNTFGRELAFERDVVKELNIPGISLNPPEAWGIPSIGITGFSGFGDSTEGPYTNRNHAFEFSDNLSWIRGRHSFKAGGHIRYDMYNQVGNQFARGNFQFQNIATRLRVRRLPAWLRAADRIRGGAGGDEVPRAEPGVLLHRHVEDPSNMTLDLGIRYEYTPPWLDKNGTLMNAHIPCHDTTPNVQNRASSDAGAHRRAATSTRTPCSASRRTSRWRATAALAIGWCSTTRRTSRRGSAGPGTRARSGRSAPAPASSICRTPATRASTWRATCRDAAVTTRCC